MYISHKKIKAESTFIPIYVISVISLLLYLGGLLGLLLPAFFCVFTGGIGFYLYFINDLARERCRIKRPSLFQVFFFTGTAMFLALLWNTKFQHYDNFSHWAIVVKQMLSTDAVPNADSALIEFSNYPLGTASFLYYVCKILGRSQGTMLFAQGLLIFSCFYAFFGIIREKKRFLLYSFLGAGCAVLSVFNITIRINNLLVDFILPVMSLAAIAILYRYKDSIQKACALVCPILGLLAIVKSTGVIFSGFAALYLVYVFLKSGKGKKPALFLFLGLTLFLAFLPAVIWSIHMKVNFQSVENKFELSAEAMENGYTGKTPEDIKAIKKLFVQSVTDIRSRPVIGFLAFQSAAMAACLFARLVLKKKWSLRKVLLFSDLILVLYYTGILGLYLFSMPVEEALYLAGFERYASSIIVFFCGALLLSAVVDMENSFYIKIGDREDYRSFRSIETKKNYQTGILLSMGAALAFLFSEYNGLLYINQTYESSLPSRIQAVTGDRWYPDGQADKARYLLYASDKDGQMTNYYVQYAARYFLYASQVDAICAFYEDNLLNLLGNYDYLVIVESDGPERRLMQKYFQIEGKEGIYRIEELLSSYPSL